MSKDITTIIEHHRKLKLAMRAFIKETPWMASLYDDGSLGSHPMAPCMAIMEMVEGALYAKYGKEMMIHGRAMNDYYRDSPTRSRDTKEES